MIERGIIERLKELGFSASGGFPQLRYRREEIEVEIFDTLPGVYMVTVTRHRPNSVWAGAHFPLSVPVGKAIDIVTNHHGALCAALCEVSA